MTDSLKFGPEWLRNLSQDGPTTGTGGGGGPRYQLAEHRYGREEMLALFDRSLGQPELLGRFKSLYVERLQLPLALAPTQEDENRGWMPRPMTGMSGVRGGGRGGASVDRGRGRGGRGSYHSQGGGGVNMSSVPYQRSQSSFEPDEVGLRITSRQPARPWNEQNGETEWNGSTSPRKEYSTTGRANMDNWRRHRGTEEDDGWRNQPEPRRPDSKWTRGGGGGTPSWRDGETDGSGDRELSRGFERLERELRERGTSERGDRAPPPAVTRSWYARKPWDVDDILPEWAMENPSESGGTFDASGAFHGSDEEQERGARLNHSHSTNNMQSPKPAPLSRSQTQGSIAVNKHSTTSITDTPGKIRSREHPGNELSHSEEDLNQHRKMDDKRNKPTRNNKPDREISIEHLDQDQHQKSNSTEAQKPSDQSRTQSPSKSVSQQGTPKKTLKENETSKMVNDSRKTDDGKKNNSDSINVSHTNEDLTKSKLKQYVGQEDEGKKLPEIQKQSAPHDEFARMQEVADDIVAQLMMDEDRSPVIPVVDQYKVVQPQPGGLSVSPLSGSMVSPPTVHNVMPLLPPSVPGSDKWFYRDPQGEVQGPFLANEMGEWYRAGYFTNELMVRRACDERYTTLGELVKICGGAIPFSPSARLPPLKVDPSLNNGLPPSSSGLIPGTVQFRQAQLLNRQIAARQEAHAQVLRELSRSERWGTMTPGEQNAVLMQHLAQIPFPDAFAPPTVPAGLGIPPIVPMTQPTPPPNPLLQLISQMQQAKQPSNIMSQVPPMDPMKQQSSGAPHMNHLSGMGGHPNIPMPGGGMNHNNHINNTMHSSAALNQVLNQSVPISTPDQLNQNANNSEPLQKGDDLMSMFKQFFTKMGNNKTPAESGSWNPSWNNANNIGSMWDMQIPKPEMKTEQQILEEQLRHRKEAEAKEKENREKEHKRQLEEAQSKLQQEKAKKQAEIDEKLKAQKEAEERQREEQKRKEQEKKKAEEKEKRESERVKKELEKAKREAEEKRLRELEEKRRLKEERKREEEMRKDSEKRKAEEAQRAKEQEEEARRAAEEEAKRKTQEAKKIQEQQRQAAKVAPWRPPVDPPTNTTSSLSLAEIQRLEKEKRAEQLKEQAQQQALRQQQAQMLKEQEIAAANERSAIQLKWANQKPQISSKVKSLAEIQAEEMAKQAAADKLAAQQRERESPVVQQTNSIWSSAPSLNWTSTAWTTNTGFWDETPTPSPPVTNVTPSKIQNKSSPKTPSVLVNNSPSQNKTSVTPSKSTVNQNTSNHNGGQKQNSVSSKPDKNASTNNNNSNKKKKKDEKDDFTNWCTKAMSSINSSVDVPTFIGFLNDIDSPYEVKDYIRTYLGDSKDAIEFSKQFLERRSRFRNQQRLATAHIDDMCSPAPAINPGSEFHEQGKGKKSKKNKMQKIDNRILGFNVTAAQDRINIGDRDYGDAN